MIDIVRPPKRVASKARPSTVKPLKQREESNRERAVIAPPRLTCIRRGEYYSSVDVAALFSLSLKSVKEMIDSGEWVGRKAKGAWIITGDSIADWSEQPIKKQIKKS